mgnify:CR=1 FL=1
MAISIISVKFPECGATLDIEEGSRQRYCQFCGSKLLIDNDNEFVYRTVNDADIIRAKTERMAREKQLEIAEKEREAKKAKNEKIKTVAIKLSLIVAVILIIWFIFGLLCLPFNKEFASVVFNKLRNNIILIILLIVVSLIPYWMMFNIQAIERMTPEKPVKTAAPDIPNGFRGKNYIKIVEVFRISGFTNINSVDLKDIDDGSNYGKVESVTINGQKAIPGVSYKQDSPVVVYYHGMK